jgi:hypothetical protein
MPLWAFLSVHEAQLELMWCLFFSGSQRRGWQHREDTRKVLPRLASQLWRNLTASSLARFTFHKSWWMVSGSWNRALMARRVVTFMVQTSVANKQNKDVQTGERHLRSLTFVCSGRRATCLHPPGASAAGKQSESFGSGWAWEDAMVGWLEAAPHFPAPLLTVIGVWSLATLIPFQKQVPTVPVHQPSGDKGSSWVYMENRFLGLQMGKTGRSTWQTSP